MQNIENQNPTGETDEELIERKEYEIDDLNHKISQLQLSIQLRKEAINANLPIRWEQRNIIREEKDIKLLKTQGDAMAMGLKELNKQMKKNE